MKRVPVRPPCLLEGTRKWGNVMEKIARTWTPHWILSRTNMGIIFLLWSLTRMLLPPRLLRQRFFGYTPTPFKGRILAWKNMRMNMVRLGIVREKIDLKVGELELGKVELHELIYPSMIILSDYNKEENIDLLNNVKNICLDNFTSI